MPNDPTPNRRVRLFRNGANQTVRIPKEVKLPGHEATLRKVSNRLVLEVVMPEHRPGSVSALLSALKSMAELGPIRENLPYPEQRR